MGIKSLSAFLNKKFPSIYQKGNLSEFEGKKIAVDTSVYICKYKAIYGERWLSSFFSLVCCFRKYNIHCFFVFDSKAPVEKQKEKEKRAESKEKNAERLFDIEHAVDMYNNQNEISPILIEYQKKKKISPILLGDGINIFEIEKSLEKSKNQIFSITPEDYENLKELFQVLGVPYVYAFSEAETLCADLCKQGKVEAVLSEDTDLLVYGTPRFLSKLDSKTGSFLEIRYEKCLEALGMSSSQFTDFCIMCGTDYNQNLKKIGVARSFDFMKKYGSIEKFAKETKADITILNHERVRQIFTEYEKYKEEIPYCLIPDIDNVERFIVKHRVGINTDYVKKCLITKIVFLED